MKARDFARVVDHEKVVAAIRAAEARSTGELRVHVAHLEIDDAHRAAIAKFEALKMTTTRERNGVLIFIAPRSRKFAVIGDTAIHARCGDELWREMAAAMSQDFRAGRFTEGIVKGLARAGDLLAQHFPRPEGRPDANELGDEVTED
ncbi:MAG: TPM domain-containing protein [Vicinamibacteria bacterium]